MQLTDHIAPLPLIGVNACSQHLPGSHPSFVVGEKYVQALAQGAGGIPLIIPALGERLPMAQLMAQLDGVLLTGSPSNIEPHHYQGEPSAPGTHHDAQRDATTLPLVRAALDAGVPLLGICRGFQELNVALGGSLYQKVHESGRFKDHREDKAAPFAHQYGVQGHSVRIVPGGLLAKIWDSSEPVRVNSLHEQGVKALAPGLMVEAVAEDGLVEAFSVKDARSFALGVQWHPEWQWHASPPEQEFPFYRALLKAFGEACMARRMLREQRGP